MSTLPIKILYVEDNPADAFVFESCLTEVAPVEVTVLEDGEKALQFLESMPFWPDVIVLDVCIPKVDGLTVLAALKENPKLNSIPVLVFVLPDSPDCHRANALKADLCKKKPLKLDDYRYVVDDIQNLSRRSLPRDVALT